MFLHLSRASLKLFLWTSNWKTVLSQSVEALSLPPCFLRKASKPFSEGYFSLPMNTTGTQLKKKRMEEIINVRNFKRKNVDVPCICSSLTCVDNGQKTNRVGCLFIVCIQRQRCSQSSEYCCEYSVTDLMTDCKNEQWLPSGLTILDRQQYNNNLSADSSKISLLLSCTH